MIREIYGSSQCSKCKNIKEEYPNAKYFDVDKMTWEEKVELREKIKNQTSASKVNYPICFDEKGRLIL